jgi:hypothetical protein
MRVLYACGAAAAAGADNVRTGFLKAAGHAHTRMMLQCSSRFPALL